MNIEDMALFSSFKSKPTKGILAIKHFTSDEFDSPDQPGSGSLMSSEFLLILDAIREECNFPFIITSGYRTPAHNQELQDQGKKSVDDSAHTHGYAADIRIDSSTNRILLIKIAIKHGVNRIGVGSNFVHLDIDPLKPKDVMWTYA